MKNSQLPMIGKILKKIASQIGATVLVEPQWNVVGQVTFLSGRRRYFRLSTLDINHMGASAVAKDKDNANFFMNKMGYPIIQGEVFFEKKWATKIGSEQDIDAGWRYAQKIGLPVIVKPNSGTRGNGVALVYTKREFNSCMHAIFKMENIALVQTKIHGRDYRIVVLDGEVISAYERIPLNIIGDGTSTVSELLQKKQQIFERDNRDTEINMKDKRMELKLKHAGLSLLYVPVEGECIFLLDNANLSSGGDSIDVTETIHPSFKKMAIHLTSDMGLRFCGVDIIVDGDINQGTDKYWILEINSAPGLDHYVANGKAQQKIVEDLYLKVLKGMDQ